MKNLKQAELKDKKVLLRVNFDVPLSAGKIKDDSRIKQSIPTIKYILTHGGKVFVLTHLGRPEGKDASFSVLTIAKYLKKALGKEVVFIDDVFSPCMGEVSETLDRKTIAVFENIRFWQEEEQNNFNFAKDFAKNFDIYVNDAFPVAHRAHATVEAITRYLPSYAGLSLDKEVEELSKVKDSPHHPFVVIIGGAKVSDKAGVILNLAKKADYLLIGGALANTFLVERGYKVGSSLVDKESLKLVSKIMDKVSSKIMLPIDAVCAASLQARRTQVVDIHSIPSQICSIPYGIYDIGPKTLIKWEDIIKTPRTVFWAGPMGAFEHIAFSKGTKKVAQMVSRITAQDHETVVGGGDTQAALDSFGIKKFTHVSTAGSAMLAFVGGEELPGIKALERNR